MFFLLNISFWFVYFVFYEGVVYVFGVFGEVDVVFCIDYDNVYCIWVEVFCGEVYSGFVCCLSVYVKFDEVGSIFC